MSLVFIILFSLFIKHYTCFNVDVKSPIVYADPLQKLSSESTYFGYSLVLYPGNGLNPSWVLIGAPRGNNVYSSKNPGVCLKCGIKEKCNIVRFSDYHTSINANNLPRNNTSLGGSMDISYSQGRVVTCAPRQIKISWRQQQIDNYYLEGSCYWFHVNESTTQTLLPFYEESEVVNIGDGSVYYYAFGQAGFSVHMPNSKESELLLGAPGVLNWKGTSVLYTDGEDFDPIVSRRKRQIRKQNVREFAKKDIAPATNHEPYGLLGYSSTSGYFLSNTDLYYVSGAPRASSYRGQVSVYTLGRYGTSISLYGDQFGEYFGASVTAGDINNDGYDDLIIGAPFYADKKYNEGRAVVYMGGDGFRYVFFSINGYVANGQFGTCVQFLGDINADGFGDVAIAAPYEEESSGVVYLYSGSTGGLNAQYYQRIVGKEIFAGIRGFGISMSRGADIDQNNYSDIAIGAYLSGHVVLLRTSPVAVITHKLKSFASSVRQEQSSFKMEACVSYTVKQINVDVLNFEIKRTIIVDEEFGRAKLQDVDISETVNFGNNNKFCQNFTVVFEKSFSNTFNPITVSLSHKFIPRQQKKEAVYVYEDTVVGKDTFCSKCPLYDENRSSKVQKVEIPFTLGCGPENICDAALEFESSLVEIGSDDTFILGSKDQLTLQTSVTNSGEKAYLTQIGFTLPKLVHLANTPSGCVQQNSSLVICSVANPLESNEKKQIFLPLDMTTVNSDKYDKNDTLIFTVMVLTSSNNKNSINSVQHLRLNLEREADVTISGMSQEQSYFYGDSKKPVTVVQNYQIEKFGSSILHEISIEVDIPYSISTEKVSALNFTSLESYKARFDDREMICIENINFASDTKANSLSVSSSRDNSSESKDHSFQINCDKSEVSCLNLVCSAGPIDSRQIATIEVKMVFDIAVIKDLLGVNDVVHFGTRGHVKVTNPSQFVQSGDKPDVAEVVSLFFGERMEERVAVWIIVLSVLASLILVGLLVYLLYRVGFFRRAMKEELEQLKDETNLAYSKNEHDSLKEQEHQEDITAENT